MDAATSDSRASLRRPGGPDEPDHFIHVVERHPEAEQDVLALARFAQFEIGAAAHHIDAMLDEVLDRRDQAQLARLAIDDREIDDAEADLKLRVACNRLLRITSACSPRFSSKTMRIPSRSLSSRISEMPSIFFSLTSAAAFSISRDLLT